MGVPADFRGSKEDDKYSESNVKTVIAQDATGNSTITVKLDKDPSFDSVTATGKVQGASLTDGTATLTGGLCTVLQNLISSADKDAFPDNDSSNPKNAFGT